MDPSIQHHIKQDTPSLLNRQQWLAVMARASLTALEQHWQFLGQKREYEILRAPEIGLVMAQGRAGGSGAPFNFGEISVSRSTIRMTEHTHSVIGEGYVMGCKRRQALLIALLDGYLQLPESDQGFVQTLFADQQKKRAERASKIATSKVDFFTLVRGED